MSEEVRLLAEELFGVKPKRTRVPKAPPKLVWCNFCGALIEYFPDRQICHWCRSPYWRKPSIGQRISAAISAFQRGR